MFYGGEVLDNAYQVIKEIGKGGTGVIYLAYHLRLRKYIVVKRIHDNFVGKVNVRTEADILKSLHHTGLPQVYDFIQVDREVYTVMEYIQGFDLQHYLDEGCKFEEKDLTRWLIQLCEVLEYLHTRVPPVLHSDIKPGNIMITPEGNVCLIDFNISLGGEVKTNVKGLSKWYAAPEQIEKVLCQNTIKAGHRTALDGRMDLYSLGATFYRLMTGMLPAQGSQGFVPITSMALPYSQGLATVVGKAMEWDVRKRYPAASAMLKALRHLYKSDSQYKRLKVWNACLYAGCGLTLLLGIWSIAYGWKSMCREAYEKDYKKFYAACGNYENEMILSAGMNLLNDKRYRQILGGNDKEWAEILYEMGNACFEQAQYGEAADYYREAKETEPQEALYYRDEAIARARDGELYMASYVLEQAKEQGIEEENILLADQEIAFWKEDYEKTEKIGERLAGAKDPELASRSSLLTAEAFGKEGDLTSQLKYLERVYQTDGGTRCLRELGQAYLKLAQQEKQSKYYREYLEKGENCYMTLQELPFPSFTDTLNLAIIWELKGEYPKSDKKLQALAAAYPDSYQVYMHLSYVCCKQEERKRSDQRNLDKANKYFEKARTLYRSHDGVPDSAMEELERILEEMAMIQ